MGEGFSKKTSTGRFSGKNRFVSLPLCFAQSKRNLKSNKRLCSIVEQTQTLVFGQPVYIRPGNSDDVRLMANESKMNRAETNIVVSFCGHSSYLIGAAL